jgi:hypothetical protein
MFHNDCAWRASHGTSGTAFVSWSKLNTARAAKLRSADVMTGRMVSAIARTIPTVNLTDFGFVPLLVPVLVPVLVPATRIIMEHSGALFDKDEAKHNVATLNCH